MNRITLLVLFVFSYCVGSSQAISQRGTSAVTVQDARLFAQYNFRPPVFADTIQANLQIGLDSCGALIFSRDINSYYFRACSPKRWVVVSSGAITSKPWDIGGNASPSSPNIGTTTATEFDFITNGIARTKIKSSGIARSSASRNKYLMIDTTDKYLYYGDAGTTIDTANQFVNRITRTPGKDSIIYFVGANRFAIKDSVGGGTTIDTISLSNRINLKIDSLKRSNDSIYAYKNGARVFQYINSDTVYTQSPIMSITRNDSNIIYFNADTANVWRGGGGVGGSGTINFVPKWSASTTLQNSQIFDSVNVGINTTSPAYKLDVNGNTRIKGSKLNDVILKVDDSLNNELIKVKFDGTTIKGTTDVLTVIGSSGIQAIIGNNYFQSPQGIYRYGGNTLDFLGGNNDGAAFNYSFKNVQQSISTVSSMINLGGIYNNQQSFAFSNLSISPTYNFDTTNTTSSAIARGIYYNPNILPNGLRNAKHIAFENTTGDVLLNTTSGNVGINTTSPTYKLDLVNTNNTVNYARFSNAQNSNKNAITFGKSTSAAMAISDSFGIAKVLIGDGQTNDVNFLTYNDNIFNFSYSNALGGLKLPSSLIKFTPDFTYSTGTNSHTILNINPNIQVTGGSNTLRGIYYNPNNTTGTINKEVAWENTQGDIVFGNIKTSGADKMVTIDSLGKLKTQTIPLGGGGTVTSVSSGYGIVNSPNPIINTGTITVDTATLSNKYLRIVDTSNKWVNNITRISGKDSIIYFVGGNRFAIKDSVGNTSGFVPYTGATQNLNLGTHNIIVNNVDARTTTLTASNQTIPLSLDSSFIQLATGTTSNIFYNLPNATTLNVGASFQFNNNTTSGAISVRNFGVVNTISTIPAGGAVQIVLLTNTTTTGTWDVLNYCPKNTSWGTDSLSATSTKAKFSSLVLGTPLTVANGGADSITYYTKYRSDTSRTNIYNGINLRVKYTDTSTMLSNYQTAINNKVNISDPNQTIAAFQYLGSSIKFFPIGVNSFIQATTNLQFISTRIFLTAIYVPTTTTVTGVKWITGSAGIAYVGGSNYNGIALYSYNVGTGLCTRIDSTASDPNTWATAGFQSKAFVTFTSLTQGVYFLAAICNGTATTFPSITQTAPQSAITTYDFTSPAKLTGNSSGIVSPASFNLSTITSTTNTPVIALY